MIDMSFTRIYISMAFVAMILVALTSGCISDDGEEAYAEVDREGTLPLDIEKMAPEDDLYPPMLHDDSFEQPIPLPYPLNTSGAEDSPFILPDGNTLYFFFTPDVRVSPQEQLLDGVTGVWASKREEGTWSVPERVWLQDPGKLSLDGAVSIYDGEMFFASAREGYEGMNIFTAEYDGEHWTNWQYAGDRLMREIMVGEVHLQGDQLYFHSDRPGGFGGYDIWLTTRGGDSWTDPLNISVVNTEDMDGFPFISPDGNELWFTRGYMGSPAVYRSVREGDEWGEPELIVSQFAGEPTLDEDGNLYFVHHFYVDGAMVEADIYVAYRK